MKREKFDAKNIARFLSKVEKTDGCWFWMAGLNRTGYGQFAAAGKNIRAHRYSYEFHKGLIPKDMLVMHSCDQRNCVNPDHLALGTDADNVHDAMQKNRHQKGESNGKCKLKESQVLEILSGDEPTDFFVEKFNISKEQVCKIRAGKQWKHLNREGINE